ncbi:CYTH domain-containing protein [Candidatus Falkowbacteria bacterium]|nr:CYTH domain-containing protein [Candidatus Falkowbacteria bacterium]
MNIEYEATFINIDKDEMREKLREAGAVLAKPEFLQKRMVFNLPRENEINGSWLRVRDEGDKITMSLKIVDGDKIENQREVCLKVDSFDEAVKMLEMIGARRKSYQETKRELWLMDNVYITIDEWPFLEPFVEVEGASEEIVRKVSEKIGFNYNDALFCAVGKVYELKYGIPEKEINNNYPLITFEMENPF